MDNQNKYREELAKLYFRIRNSENIEIKKEAISFLFYLYCEKEDYDKAAALLRDYPADTKLMMAHLHQHKKEYEPDFHCLIRIPLLERIRHVRKNNDSRRGRNLRSL